MTDSSSARSTPLRHRIAAASALAAFAAPVVAIGPATAAPACPQPQRYGAVAQAELIRLNAIDLRPLGVAIGPVGDVRVGTTASGFAAQSPVRSAAAARSLEAHLLGRSVPLGPLGTSVFQQAPPVTDSAATATGLRRTVGALTVGVADVSSRATWADGRGCGANGQSTGSSAAIANAVVLPGLAGRSLLAVPDTLGSRTATGIEAHKSIATAAVSVAELRLFDGTGSTVTVKVIKPPTLTVRASGDKHSSSVDYHSPILEISGPGIGTHRLDTPGKGVELTVPPSGSAKSGLPGNPLGDLLAKLTGKSVKSNGAARNLDLPGVTGLPELLPAKLGESTPLTGELPVVRLSLGTLNQRITDQSVQASAATLRLEVLAPALAGKTEGYEHGQAGGSVADLGIGLLSAAAVAPKVTPPTGGVQGEEAPPASLPVTGPEVGLLVAAGALVLILGRFLVVVARRRA